MQNIYDKLKKKSILQFSNIDVCLQGQDIVNIPVMLVGNKCDESDELRNVSEMEGKAQAASWNVSFMETSAKTNHNVTELFQVIIKFNNVNISEVKF